MSGNHWTCKITTSYDVSEVSTEWYGSGSAKISMEYEQGIRLLATITNDSESPAVDDGGDTIAITSLAGVPCLDASEKDKPFYNSMCKTQLPDAGAPDAEFDFSDSPDSLVPNIAKDAGEERKFCVIFTRRGVRACARGAAPGRGGADCLALVEVEIQGGRRGSDPWKFFVFHSCVAREVVSGETMVLT